MLVLTDLTLGTELSNFYKGILESVISDAKELAKVAARFREEEVTMSAFIVRETRRRRPQRTGRL